MPPNQPLSTGAGELHLVFGGVLTEVGWRFTFLLPVPIALAILLAAPRFLAVDREVRVGRQRFDIAGAVTVTAGMLLLVRTVVEAPDVGWLTVETVIPFLAALALLGAFVVIERRAREPLVRLGILRTGSLSRANLGAMAVFGAYVGFQFVTTLYLQNLLGWSALETALGFLPGGLLVAFGAPRVGALVERLGTERVIAVGAAAFVIGYALFLRIDESTSYFLLLFPTMLLIGIGFALCFPSLNIQATSGVADSEQGLASGLVSTSFQVGGAIVLAVVSAIVASQTGSATDPASLLDGYRPAIAVVALVAGLGLIVALTGIARRRQARVPAMATE